MNLGAIKWDDNHYNCIHFLIDAVKRYRGIDLTSRLLTNNQFDPQKLKNFKPIDAPQQHCIVLLRDDERAHVGLWLDNEMLHMTERGAKLQPLSVAAMTFKRVVYYDV